MFFDQTTLLEIFSPKDYSRGLEYYQQGRVNNIKISTAQNSNHIICTVNGQRPYRVYLLVELDSVSTYCSCPRFAEKKICKHIAAAMLACAAMQEDEQTSGSDRWAQNMLHKYMDRISVEQTSQTQKARFVPRLHLDSIQNNSYPAFSFQVGFNKLYAIRDVKKFSENVLRRETVSYGKGLTLYHAPEKFDEHSQKLLSILLEQFMQQGYNFGYSVETFASGYQKNLITFTGSAFDQIYDLYLDLPMDSYTAKNAFIFSIRVPKVTVSLMRHEKSAVLHLSVENGEWNFFGGSQNLYAIGSGQVLRCSKQFKTKENCITYRKRIKFMNF